MPNGKFSPMPADGDRARRRFATEQVAKAALGGLLWFAYVMLVGPPDLPELIALAGFAAPCALGLLALAGVSLDVLEGASFVCFAGLIGYMVAITGGMHSPLLVWFVVLPTEAALAGGRACVLRAAVAAGLALAAVALFESLHALPRIQPLAPYWQVYAGSVLMAIIQSALIAIAAQERQRTADRAASEGAEIYRFLAENATDLITRHGPDGAIRYASPAARRLLTIEPNSLEGRSLSALVYADDLECARDAIGKAAVSERQTTAEVRLRRADGSFVATEMRCRRAVGRAGRAGDVVAVTRDIAERKAQEEALIAARETAEEASRAKSRYLAHMSHELRTPLNAILGFSEVMSHEMYGALGNPQYVEYARLIHECGGHLLELINGVLDMSKIEAGKFDLSETAFDLEAAAGQALRLVKLQAERKGVALKTSIAPGARTVFADQRAVKQILLNLLANAVKFTPRGGTVWVAAAREGGAVELAVADTGIGIAESDLDRLCQPFEQADSAPSQEGTGLGLSLVKALATLHEGEVRIQSARGEGTVVRVRLPRAAVTDVKQPLSDRFLQDMRAALKGAA
ncbi:MAG TPA: PAS domain-containing sensor histidine kinase [Rhizomicrobium sp.]|nr:PAS domain-containing sensor histidine kinase [Rhizomicrobium sp.]